MSYVCRLMGVVRLYAGVLQVGVALSVTWPQALRVSNSNQAGVVHFGLKGETKRDEQSCHVEADDTANQEWT